MRGHVLGRWSRIERDVSEQQPIIAGSGAAELVAFLEKDLKIPDLLIQVDHLAISLEQLAAQKIRAIINALVHHNANSLTLVMSSSPFTADDGLECHGINSLLLTK